MRFISTKVHGILDYLTGVVLILAPWLFNFAIGGPAQWVAIIVGIGIIVMALMTDYEYSATRRIAMPTHLNIDIIMGIFLAISPWLFGFSELVFWPHLIVGILEIGAGLMTERVPDYRTASTTRTT